MLALNEAEKNKVLPIKACQRRNSCQRKQENQHHDGLCGSAEVQSRNIINLVANHFTVPQRGNHRERPQVHERVNHQVKQDSLEPIIKSWLRVIHRRQRNQSQQHVSHMRDGGVGQQALQIILGERRQVRPGHGGDRNKNNQRKVHAA